MQVSTKSGVEPLGAAVFHFEFQNRAEFEFRHADAELVDSRRQGVLLNRKSALNRRDFQCVLAHAER